MAVAKPLTLEAFLRMEETEPYSEFVCGEAIQKPIPSRLHSKLQMYLGYLLFQFLARTGLGEILPEFRCIFGPPGRPRALVPDLAYVSTARITRERFLHAAPDLAIEILSPDQDMARFTAKIHFYLQYGVRQVWVIDPERETIAVLTPGEEDRTLAPGDTLDGGDLLPGFSVSVEELFAQARAV